MSPKSLLLFSSDQETSRQLTQALAELDFQVEHCPEIFVAVEKLTSRSFDVIVTDWDDGIEADFLLKTGRELKSNRTAFTIAVTRSDAVSAARQAGADMVLTKPVLPGQVRHALATSEEFAARMAAPKFEEPAPSVPTVSAVAPARPVPETKRQSTGFLQTSPLPPSPTPSSSGEEDAVVPISVPVNPAYVPEPTERTRYSRIQTLFSSNPQSTPRPAKPRSPRLFSIAIFGLILVPSGALFYSPVTRAAVKASVSGTYDQVAVWLTQPSTPDAKPETASGAWAGSPAGSGPSLLPERIRTIFVRRHGTAASTTGAVATGVSGSTTAKPSPAVDMREPFLLADQAGVPPSLSAPPAAVPIHDSGLTPSPSVLNALEPVQLLEEQSQKLVVQKVQPAYPEQALRSGLQGPVVFQVSVAKDGSVRDLKLVHGSFLLGQAAFPAVRQWRFKPYFINGRAVETQTQVTVEFKLPAVAQVADPQP